jgi:hypothetical protein
MLIGADRYFRASTQLSQGLSFEYRHRVCSYVRSSSHFCPKASGATKPDAADPRSHKPACG